MGLLRQRQGKPIERIALRYIGEDGIRAMQRFGLDSPADIVSGVELLPWMISAASRHRGSGIR